MNHGRAIAWARARAGVPAMLASLALAALAGCVSPSPQEHPPLPIADAWPADTRFDAMPDDGPAAAMLDWHAYFVEPRLVFLIETALANNRDLRLALLRVEEARAAYGIQRADRFPTLSVDAQGSRSRVPGDLNVSGQPVTGGQYYLQVGLATWEIDLWGRVRSLNDAALQEYLATDAAQRAVRSLLVAEVANAYIGLRDLDERIALARETIASRQESFRIFSRRHQVGSTSKLDLTQVETLLLQSQALGAQLAQARAAQAHALGLLLGTPIELPPVVDTPLRDEAVFADVRVGLPSELLTHRPDIIAAEHRLLASRANIHAARAAFFPRIALTAASGTASAELDGLFDSGSRAWSLIPTISLPIFDGGRRRAALDLAEVRRDMAVANYEKSIQQAFREVSDALSARQWLARQIAVQRQTVSVQSERARLATLRYDSGAAAYLEVLDAQRDLLAAQQQLVQVRREWLSSQVALYTALGGGAAVPASSPENP